ncbi:MAG: ABC transporter ATP-binding protein [Candidatus Humimicrobiaceae bacterium]
MDILKVKNLNFSYDGNEVLRDVSFNVRQGSFISILGPNGSGKSTLINILSKVLKKFEGNITINSKSLDLLRPKEVAKLVAVVPQSTSPSFNFSVKELVSMGRYPYSSRFEAISNKDSQFIDEVMEKVKISEFAERKYNELSGGEKQRVIIAQALVQDTPILLLDEPTAHLDINFQIELLELFHKLNIVDKKTVIGIFHDINLAIQYSRKVMFLKDGRIFKYGNTSDVVNEENIERVFSSEVYVAKNPFTGKIYINPTFNTRPQRDGKTRDLRIHVIGGGGAASPIINSLYRKGYIVSCGVVNNLDTDLATCETLEIPYVSEAPFSPVSLYAQNKNLELINLSDVVILPPIEIGNGNFSNLVSVKEALDKKKKVIVISGESIEQRDHTGGKASTLYRKIIEREAKRIGQETDILSILEDINGK